MSGETSVLGWLDISMFAAMLGFSALIGVYFALTSKQDSAKEYLMGGKNMDMLPVSISLVASFVSGITILGVPAEVYRYGTQYIAVGFAFVLIGVTTATIFVPLYTKLQICSCYEYLELRFNKRVRRVASVLFAISQMFYIPVVIYVPALAFSQVTGINVHIVTPITCLVCIFYTTLGGLRAVVWTDALQTVVMMAAIIIVMVLGAEKLGGWSRVWEINETGDRLQFFNLDPNPFQRHSFWTVVVGIYFMFLSECAAGQGFVQRYLSVSNLRTAKMTVALFSSGLASIVVLSVANGLLVYAAYADCDPIISKRASRPDQLLPLFVMDVAGHIPGFTGLFVAGVFSAALSSMSTGLNALSGVLVEDLFQGYLSTRFSTGTWLKTSAAVMGFVCVGLVYLVEHLGGVLQAALSLTGITSGTMLGLFTLGMFFPKAHSKGALVGSVISLSTVGFIVFGAQHAQNTGALVYETLPVSVENCTFGNFSLPRQNLTDAAASAGNENDEVWLIFKLSFMYYSLLGTGIVLMVGNLVSVICNNEDQIATKKIAYPDLFCPLVHRFLPPEKKSPEETGLTEQTAR